MRATCNGADIGGSSTSEALPSRFQRSMEREKPQAHRDTTQQPYWSLDANPEWVGVYQAFKRRMVRSSEEAMEDGEKPVTSAAYTEAGRLLKFMFSLNLSPATFLDDGGAVNFVIQDDKKGRRLSIVVNPAGTAYAVFMIDLVSYKNSTEEVLPAKPNAIAAAMNWLSAD